MLQILTVTGQWGLSFAVALAGALLGEAYFCGRDSGASKAEKARLTMLRNNLVGAAIAIPLLLHVGGVLPYALTLADAKRARDNSKTMVIAAIQGNITKEAMENGNESGISTQYDGDVRRFN